MEQRLLGKGSDVAAGKKPQAAGSGFGSKVARPLIPTGKEKLSNGVKDNNSNNNVSKLKGVVSAAHGGSPLKSHRSGGGRRAQEDVYGNDASPSGRGGQGMNGFQKLQLRVSGKAPIASAGGPVMVTYEEDNVSSGNRHSPMAKELRTESEHLYLGGKDSERIGEDQLSKLLNKAKRAR
jgi:hypothetical protein